MLQYSDTYLLVLSLVSVAREAYQYTIATPVQASAYQGLHFLIALASCLYSISSSDKPLSEVGVTIKSNWQIAETVTALGYLPNIVKLKMCDPLLLKEI